MHERLGQVAPQLVLGNVELLGQQARRPACGSVALEPAQRRRSVALLVGVLCSGLPYGYLVGLVVGTAVYYAMQRGWAGLGR